MIRKKTRQLGKDSSIFQAPPEIISTSSDDPSAWGVSLFSL